MKVFQFILRVLLAALVSLVVGFMVCMAFILAGLKFESGQFPVFFMMAGWVGGWFLAFVFFIGAVNRLNSRFKQEQELHKTGSE